jgi:phage gpG-like protein
VIRAELRGGEQLLGALKKMGDAAGPGGRQRMLQAAGRHMVSQEIPTIFAQQGPGWPRPKYRGGQPLQDTGRLRDSISFRVEPNNLVVGTRTVYGGIQQRGGVVKPGPGKKFLAIPLSPPLSKGEARAGNPRSFKTAFVLMKGPDGPGIYRRSLAARSTNLKTRRTSYSAGTHTIERIFALVRSVKIPARPYLKWTPRAVAKISALWIQMVKP